MTRWLLPWLVVLAAVTFVVESVTRYQNGNLQHWIIINAGPVSTQMHLYWWHTGKGVLHELM